jgi:hypothetical protein
MRTDGDAAQECLGDSYCRSFAATLNCLAAIGSAEAGLAARWFDTQLQKPACQQGWANSAASLKQAVFGHLREF